jgi:hemoglobin
MSRFVECGVRLLDNGLSVCHSSPYDACHALDSHYPAAFYRQVPQDDLLGPIYPASDLPGAEQRLRDFLIGRFGGPQTYIEQRGHPRLRARHSPFAINQTIRDRWMRLMENALGEALLPSNAEEALRKFFNEMSTFMINQSEPGIS